MLISSVSVRRFLRYFLPASALMVVIAAAVAWIEPRRSITALRASDLNHVRDLSRIATDELDIVVADLLLLANNSHLRALLDGDELGARSDLFRDLLDFSARKRVFDQVRYLDESGMEIIRVNYGDGNPYLVPPEELQPKGDRYYFRDTYSLNETQAFVSPLDLNIEFGQLEFPLKPMIRFGTPVFDSQGRKRGVSPSKVIQSVVELIPPSWQYPETTQARISVDEQRFETGGFRETPWIQSSELTISGNSEVVIEVCYLEERPGAFEGPFLKEERELIDAIGRDIGVFVDRYRAHSALEEMTLTLERKVKERTTELDDANKNLKAFSYSVSHDLQAPLRAIRGFSEILLEDSDSRLDAEGRRILGVIAENAASMTTLIHDLLRFSRIGRHSLALSAIDMNGVVAGVLSDLEGHLENIEIKVSVEPLPPARGDHILIRQVWVNLLSNAFKFSGSRDVIRVQVNGRVEGEECIYWVKDNGEGFDMAYAEKLFNVFERIHSKEEYEGTGIGLAIVKHIVDRHGGRVWAEGKVDEGATFWFTLPNSPD